MFPVVLQFFKDIVRDRSPAIHAKPQHMSPERKTQSGSHSDCLPQTYAVASLRMRRSVAISCSGNPFFPYIIPLISGFNQHPDIVCPIRIFRQQYNTEVQRYALLPTCHYPGINFGRKNLQNNFRILSYICKPAGNRYASCGHALSLNSWQ